MSPHRVRGHEAPRGAADARSQIERRPLLFAGLRRQTGEHLPEGLVDVGRPDVDLLRGSR